MNNEEKKRKILEEEDFIDYPKFKNSIKKLIEKNPDGVDNETIAKSLGIEESEVEALYQSAVEKLQKTLGV